MPPILKRNTRSGVQPHKKVDTRADNFKTPDPSTPAFSRTRVALKAPVDTTGESLRDLGGKINVEADQLADEDLIRQKSLADAESRQLDQRDQNVISENLELAKGEYEAARATVDTTTPAGQAALKEQMQKITDKYDTTLNGPLRTSEYRGKLRALQVGQTVASAAATRTAIDTKNINRIQQSFNGYVADRGAIHPASAEAEVEALVRRDAGSLREDQIDEQVRVLMVQVINRRIDKNADDFDDKEGSARLSELLKDPVVLKYISKEDITRTQNELQKHAKAAVTASKAVKEAEAASLLIKEKLTAYSKFMEAGGDKMTPEAYVLRHNYFMDVINGRKANTTAKSNESIFTAGGSPVGEGVPEGKSTAFGDKDNPRLLTTTPGKPDRTTNPPALPPESKSIVFGDKDNTSVFTTTPGEDSVVTNPPALPEKFAQNPVFEPGTDINGKNVLREPAESPDAPYLRETLFE